jgi:hypothetical protein
LDGIAEGEVDAQAATDTGAAAEVPGTLQGAPSSIPSDDTPGSNVAAGATGDEGSSTPPPGSQDNEVLTQVSAEKHPCMVARGRDAH